MSATYENFREVNTREGKELFKDKIVKRINGYKTSTNKFRLIIQRPFQIMKRMKLCNFVSP